MLQVVFQRRDFITNETTSQRSRTKEHQRIDSGWDLRNVTVCDWMLKTENRTLCITRGLCPSSAELLWADSNDIVW